MSRVFVDTAGWVCLADRQEHYHQAAVSTYRAIRDEARIFVTTNYVLTELVAVLLSPKRFARSLIVSFVESIKTAPHVQIVHVEPELDEEAWQIFRSRTDKNWSLVDCASFVVMRKHGILEALTTDHHFEQAGFVRLLKP